MLHKSNVKINKTPEDLNIFHNIFILYTRLFAQNRLMEKILRTIRSILMVSGAVFIVILVFFESGVPSGKNKKYY